MSLKQNKIQDKLMFVLITNSMKALTRNNFTESVEILYLHSYNLYDVFLYFNFYKLLYYQNQSINNKMH